MTRSSVGYLEMSGRQLWESQLWALPERPHCVVPAETRHSATGSTGQILFALKDAADERVRPLMGRPVQVDRETLTLRHAGGIPAPCGTSSGSATYGVDARSILLDVDRRAGSGTRRT